MSIAINVLTAVFVVWLLCGAIGALLSLASVALEVGRLPRTRDDFSAVGKLVAMNLATGPLALVEYWGRRNNHTDL